MSTWTPEYRAWRGGGWYVDNVHYPSGAVGCVSRNYADKKWRIVCDRDFTRTFRSRDDAARAEREDTIRVQAEQDNSHALDSTLRYPRCCACRSYIEREDNFCPGCGAQLHAMAPVDAQIARKKHAEVYA